MAEKDIEIRRRNLEKLIRRSNRFGSHRNAIRLNSNNTWEHESKKIEICWRLIREKKQFYTEAIVDSGNRIFDILDIDDNLAIEVKHTESDESIEEKRKTALSLGLDFEVVEA